MSFNNFSSLRFSYQLLYIRTVLQGKLISPANVSSYDLLHSKNTSMSSRFLASFFRKSLIGTTRSSLNSLRLFKPLIKNYKVPARAFSFFKSHRVSFILSFVNLLKKTSSSRRSLRNINSLLYPSLRLINLSFGSGKSFISPNTNNSFNHLLLKTYSSFLFLYPSCRLDEVSLNTLLHFISNKYSFFFSASRQFFILNRLPIASFFFKSVFGKNRFLNPSSLQRQNKVRQHFYTSTKKLLCSFLRHHSSLRLRFKNKYNTVRRSRLKLVRRRYKKLRALKTVLNGKKLKLFNSYRWFSLNNTKFFVFNTNAMRTFVTRLNQLIYRSSVLSVQSTSYFNSYRFSEQIPYMISHSSLLSFYKRRRLLQMRRFLKRIRFLNKHTYHLYLKGTGSNIYSTFLRNNRVLYSMWSGLFGFKKRLKYRKGAGHKISHFFHRYISVLYKKKRIYKLNLIINGFSKFLSICIDALSRQLAYSANYYLNTEKYPQRLPSMIKCLPSYYSNHLKKKWSSSFLRSFVSPFVSSHLSVNLNSADLSLFVPELSSDELSQLVSIVNSDNVERSNLLLRLIRTRRYKKTSMTFLDSFSVQRSALITKLITIFMARYGISSKKDFYKSVSYLNKYKSIIFSSINVDKSDFFSAYSIIYLLQILKQNQFYFNKIMSYSILLRRRFGIYLKKVRLLKYKLRKIKRKKKKLFFFSKKRKNRRHKLNLLKKKQHRLATKIKSFMLKNKTKLIVSSSSSSMTLGSLFDLFSYKLLRSVKFKTIVRRSLFTRKSSLKSLLFRLFCLFLKRSLKMNSFSIRSKKMNKLLNLVNSFSFLNLKSKSSKPTKKVKFFGKKGFSSSKKLFIRSYTTNLLRSLINNSLPISNLKLARRPKRLRFMLRRLFRSRRRLFVIKRFPRKRMKKTRIRFNTRKKARGYFFYKKNVKRRRRFSKICRLIRTRMRNFTQLIYSIGYVKYRASLSHGGCASRKRYYDKRYI